MRTFNLLPLAALTTAFIVPDARVFEHLAVEPTRQSPISAQWGNVKTSVESFADEARSTLDDALDSTRHSGEDVISWGEEKTNDAWTFVETLGEHRGRPPHHPHGPPPDDDDDDDHHHPPPHHGPPEHGPPHHGPPGHGPPHHGGPHVRSNKTVYQLISESKYTTKFAELINDYPDFIQILNGTEANHTVFAPTNHAFEKIPKHAHKPSKEMIENLLMYHVSPHHYTAGQVFTAHTIPTLLKGEHLSSEPRPQRLSISVGLRGLTVNFYSRVVATDIIGANGVIHGVDSLLIPPPNAIEIIDLLPTEFSTLELALSKTGLLDKFNTTNHPGGTFFAPPNIAFAKLGPKINMFLFSSHGLKYLKALLLYHVTVGTTLYSDAVYVANTSDDRMVPSDLVSKFSFLNRPTPCHKSLGRDARTSFVSFDHHRECKWFNINGKKKRDARRVFDPSQFAKRSLRSGPVRKGADGPCRDDHKRPHPPRGYHHFDLPTLLHDQKLSVDVVRYGPLIGMKVNGWSHVIVQDGIARDGVVQVVSDVLIPPHGDRVSRLRSHDSSRSSWSEVVSGALSGTVVRAKKMFGYENEMSVEEFKARFAGLVEE